MTTRRLPTGIVALDSLTGGFVPGLVLVVSDDPEAAEAFAHQLRMMVRVRGGHAFVKRDCPLSIAYQARDVETLVLVVAEKASESAYRHAQYADTVLCVEGTVVRVTRCRAGHEGDVVLREFGGALIE
jgi:hypothetical protein